MKVLNLRCAHAHGFEGWFASEDDFQNQLTRGLVECPLCADRQIDRLPSAPRLNLSGARAPVDAGGAAASSASSTTAVAPAGQAEAAWLRAVQQVIKSTEDVGARFPEEARRIHYGETAMRGIRGQASAEDRAALADEGIEVFALPMPAGIKGPAH